jgi:hypothetical protein
MFKADTVQDDLLVKIEEMMKIRSTSKVVPLDPPQTLQMDVE